MARYAGRRVPCGRVVVVVLHLQRGEEVVRPRLGAAAAARLPSVPRERLRVRSSAGLGLALKPRSSAAHLLVRWQAWAAGDGPGLTSSVYPAPEKKYRRLLQSLLCVVTEHAGVRGLEIPTVRSTALTDSGMTTQWLWSSF